MHLSYHVKIYRIKCLHYIDDYIMTDKPSMVTDVTVINCVNIGSDLRMVMSSIMLNTRAERRKLLNNNTRTRVDTRMIGTKKNTFQLELKKQVHSTRRK